MQTAVADAQLKVRAQRQADVAAAVARLPKGLDTQAAMARLQANTKNGKVSDAYMQTALLQQVGEKGTTAQAINALTNHTGHMTDEQRRELLPSFKGHDMAGIVDWEDGKLISSNEDRQKEADKKLNAAGSLNEKLKATGAATIPSAVEKGEDGKIKDPRAVHTMLSDALSEDYIKEFSNTAKENLQKAMLLAINNVDDEAMKDQLTKKYNDVFKPATAVIRMTGANAITGDAATVAMQQKVVTAQGTKLDKARIRRREKSAPLNQDEETIRGIVEKMDNTTRQKFDAARQQYRVATMGMSQHPRVSGMWTTHQGSAENAQQRMEDALQDTAVVNGIALRGDEGSVIPDGAKVTFRRSIGGDLTERTNAIRATSASDDEAARMILTMEQGATAGLEQVAPQRPDRPLGTERVAGVVNKIPKIILPKSAQNIGLRADPHVTLRRKYQARVGKLQTVTSLPFKVADSAKREKLLNNVYEQAGKTLKKLESIAKSDPVVTRRLTSLRTTLAGMGAATSKAEVDKFLKDLENAVNI
jgi:hypothetical protein